MLKSEVAHARMVLGATIITVGMTQDRLYAELKKIWPLAAKPLQSQVLLGTHITVYINTGSEKSEVGSTSVSQ